MCGLQLLASHWHDFGDFPLLFDVTVWQPSSRDGQCRRREKKTSVCTTTIYHTPNNTCMRNRITLIHTEHTLITMGLLMYVLCHVHHTTLIKCTHDSSTCLCTHLCISHDEIYGTKTAQSANKKTKKGIPKCLRNHL